MKPPRVIYKYHTENLREIETGMGRIALMFRSAISKGEEKSVSALTRLYCLLLAAWAETRRCKLLYEPNAFDERQRREILAKNQLDGWLFAVEVGFRQHYRIPRAALSAETLPHSAYSRLMTINVMLTTDLRPIVTLRNKLAHGQWKYPLNNDGNDVAQEQMDALRNENLLSLQFKKSLISTLSDIIHDLAVSRPAFERDFDQHYRIIVETRRNLRQRDYREYAL
jgi:hypothetical protein